MPCRETAALFRSLHSIVSAMEQKQTPALDHGAVGVRLLRLPEVTRIVGLQRSAIYQRIARKEFPEPVDLGPRTVAWPSTAIAAWVQERIAKGRA